MAGKENGFLKRLQITFKTEAEEHVNRMSSCLIEIEKAENPQKQAEVMEVVYREVHSLKGAARSVNITDIEVICQELESLFASMKRKEVPLSPPLLDILHRTMDNLRKLTASIGKELAAEEKGIVKNTLKMLENSSQPATAQSEEIPPVTAESSSLTARKTGEAGTPVLYDTVRISTSRLNSLLRQVEEFLSAKLSSTQLDAGLRQLSNEVAAWERDCNNITPTMRTLRQTLRKNGELQTDMGAAISRVLELLESNNSTVKTIQDKLSKLVKTSGNDANSLAEMVDSLLAEMKQVLLMPFSSLTEIFPVFVRDLAREQGKDIKLVITGGNIEIDRRILEEMKDPLIHMVRNCIDHGIEKPAVRTATGKPSQGLINIVITQRNSSTVEITVTDDGAGIDINRVREAAIKRGYITSENAAKLSESEALSLIYVSGVSTSSIITGISGRGLGLAIVREKVENLRGSVALETILGRGTIFHILLPLTLATFRGILVRLDEHQYIIPTSVVERVVRLKKDDIKTVENKETIPLDGKVIAMSRLRDVLAVPQGNLIESVIEYEPCVIINHDGKRIAFQVDEVVSEQEVLVKSLGRQLARVRNIMGASILATGKVVPILNVSDLVKTAVKATPVKTTTGMEIKKKKSLLVVEDSITARTLLKNILETAGYAVQTAVDGQDGYTVLRTGEFDLVVSDVDMPRMNGFNLTAKIRADKKYAEIPVVLVTALETREHRERGIDVGANAYIVKSSFDQSNLLEVIQRLI